MSEQGARESASGPAASVRPRRRRRWVLAAAALVVGGSVALVVFQPWKLVVDDVVDDAFPVAAGASSGAEPVPAVPTTSASTASSAPSAPTSPASPPAPRVLARGQLVSHEHATTGRVLVLELADGRRVLRFEGLDTSNGPDLKVWLSDAEVVDGPSGWRVFDDGRYADLGSLRGNVGNQNYDLPESVDLAVLTSVSIWCDRFDVSFGAAELTPA